MEPQELAKKDSEGSGFSKRRISSILKAPRKSARFPEPEQQENVVERAKPVEKRNSRRVSFAPANDVLLFSKDVKNPSPARSPLQELMTATGATAQNRVQVAVAEDGIQQTTAMETLLNAPLHASQQDKVSFDTVEGFGEKTVVFSTDDAFMDMTHSQTMIVASYADTSLQVDDALPSGGEKKGMFTADDASMDMSLLPARKKDLSVEKRNVSSSVSSLDQGFESFLASLSKPGGPSSLATVDTNISVAHMKTRKANVDKENLLPASVSAVMEKSLNKPRKAEESSYGLGPDVDVSMNLTEVQTGRILSVADDDNPFQCLFPTQDMYAHCDKRESQTAEVMMTKSDPKDMASSKNPARNASQPRRKVNFNARDECTEKTIRFTAGDEFMDMTQSHTVNIARGPLAPQPGSADGLESGFKNFLTGLSKPTVPSVNPGIVRVSPLTAASSQKTINMDRSLCELKTPMSDAGKENWSLNTSRSCRESSIGVEICPGIDMTMEMTETQTGHILGISGSDDPFQFLFPSQDMYPHSENLKKTSGQKNSEALGSLKHAGLHTQNKIDPEDDHREKTVRFSADDACMDVTRSHTVNIGTDFSHKHSGSLSFKDKTIRFNVKDAGMDMTQCLTVNIANNLGSDSILLSEKKQESEKRGPLRDRSSSAHGLDPESNSFLTSVPSVDPVFERKTSTAAPFSNMRDSSAGGTICPEDDVSMDMDMTEAQTGRIVGITHTDEPLQCFFPPQDIYPQSGNLKKAEMTSGRKSSGALGSSDRTGMGTSLKSSLKTKEQKPQDEFDPEDDHREKTVRFSADDACMDVTRSHTVNIGTDFSHKHSGSLSFKDKTIRFNVKDAGMDMTQCLTVNIANNLGSDSILFSEKKQESEKRGPLRDRSSSAHGLDPESNSFLTSVPSVDPVFERKTSTAAPFSNMRDSSDGGTICHEDDVSMDMDMTEAQTGRIVGITHTDEPLQCFFPPQDIYPQSGNLKKAEMTSGRKSSGALGSSDRTGVEKSLRTSFKTTMRRSQVKFDAEDDCREESVRSSPDDAATNVTDCLDVLVDSSSASDSVLPHQETNITAAHRDVDLHLIGKKRGRSFSARSLDPGFKNSLSRMSCPWVNPVRVVTPAGQRPPEGADTNDHLQIQKPGVDTTSAFMEKSQNKTMTDFTEIDQSMEMTEAQTGHIFGQSCTDELPQCFTSSQDSDLKFELSQQTEAKSRQSDEAASVEITNSTESVDSFEIVTRKEPEPRNDTTSSQKTEDGSSLSAVDQDLDTFGSRKSRRISLADIQSKVKRLSHMINTAPGAFVVESCTETLPHFDDDSKDKTKPLPAVEPELQMSLENNEEETQDQYLTRGGESPAAATPFNLKTKQLMSRLSMGGFKPKLPQIGRPSDPKVLNCAGEHTKTMTVNVTNQLSNVDHDVSDIFDEELDSSEDVSDTLNPKSPKKIPEKVIHQQEADVELLEEDVFEEDFISAVQGKKRPLPNDENNMEDEKRRKASTGEADDINDMESQSHFEESDGNLTSAPTMTTHTTDCSSSSHTASVRCEATFESTFKHSMYESQLEDYTSDAQTKLADGTITVLEFLKLFNIDFVIHNPRQSILPGRILSDTERTEMDVLRERHICRPKQTVYETDVLSLTEKVEGLKVRLQDLDKPLKTMNQPLWDEMRNSSEKELKSFGLTLKERNSFFRKTSKVLSHEMKEVLYSNLVQANLEEQQKLRGTIEEADEMIKSLDDCICDMEAELAAVEEKGFDGKPSLKSRQEEMKKVTEALADNDRQVAELELQKKQNSSKLNRLQTETRNLESHITAMHMVNEWKLGEKQENGSVYTFLHETMHLQLVYEKSKGTDADHQAERKISHINFKLQLNDEKSRCHARLVHKLLAHYVDSEASWVEKYPTSRHVPTLLHDVGLVVSRCRLLGEELRLLRMWGGLQLDILDISCEDTRVHIVFSSLKKLSKFKVVFSVGLIDQLCVVQVESFDNVIGSTGMQQIEEVVASFIPTKNLLTKIIKKIHDHLLC
ncbi:uncharacterized protein knl1 isoform X1 [Hippoglossus hippoglossus]|uniref:uncharacterized protein knl1 isoform X1 n=1 Tax=Hippoglossus hippoglossus TaxID=8267 RepID=UPI00148C6328|nr:uncharacterized protein knl1 isoform X1 [Hippoglossus hippoglossus]